MREEAYIPPEAAGGPYMETSVDTFLKDESISELFDEVEYLDLKDVKLANLTPEQEFIVSQLYSVLIQLEAIERKYREKGVDLDLTSVKRAIAGDIKGIAATSRGRKGFERKMWVTNITKDESSKGKKPTLSGFWRRDDDE